MKFLITAFLALMLTCNLYAQQDTGTGMDFLIIAPSASQLSIAEASSATLSGSSAIYSNPALLVMEPASSVEVNYTLWIADVNNQFASVNFLRDNHAFGFGIYNSRSTGFEARDRPGDAAGSFAISYLSVSAAAAYKLGPLSVGATGHYLREEVFQFRANGYAFSAGIAAELLQERVRLGAVVQNLGQMEELDAISTTLPATFRLGATADIIEFTTPGENDLPILLTLHTEWIHPLEDTPSSDYIGGDESKDFFSLALSADIADLFDIRAGYKFGPTERPVSFGLGMNIDPIIVNYAMVPFSTGFGMAHSFGIQFYF